MQIYKAHTQNYTSPLTLLGEDGLGAAYKQLFRVADDLKQAVNQYHQAHEQMTESYYESMFLLAFATDSRKGHNKHRLLAIGVISEILARAKGLPEDYCSYIRQAAPLHDIGTISLPDRILNEECDMNEEDWRQWKLHAEVGSNMLHGIDTPIMRLAAEIALTHHENFHGHGFPRGLKGQDIPLSGRIVALAYYIERLLEDFVTRPVTNFPPLVLAAINDRSGGLFDPDLVECCLANQHAICHARREIEAKVNSMLNVLFTIRGVAPEIRAVG